VRTSSTTRPTAPARSRLLAVALAVVAACALGAVAGLLRSEHFWLAAAVFTASTVLPMYALTWFLLVSRHVVKEDAHAGENVERSWGDRAGAGAFTDMVGAAGIALLALSLTGLEVSGQAVLVAVVVLGLADAAVRYLALSRRES
jgi:hypothetical protein